MFAPMLSLEATPRDASVFMTTALQLPSFGSHSSVCSPGPLVEATQKSWSPRGDAGASPARFEYSGFFPMSVTMERSTPFNYPSTSVAVAIPTKTSRSLSLRCGPCRGWLARARNRRSPRRRCRRRPKGLESRLRPQRGAGVLAAREGLCVTTTHATVLALTALRVGRQSSLILGIAALVLWAVSWSWLVGVGVTVVRVGEVAALVAGLTAVAVGLRTQPRPVGLWLGVVALVLVVGLNLLGLVLR